MPRAGDGTYTLPSGNPVQTGTIIEAAWANATLADIASELNNVVTRDGLLGPTIPMEFPSGTINSPGLTFNAESTLGVYRKAAGTLAFVANGLELLELSGGAANFSGDISGVEGVFTGDVSGAKGTFSGEIAGPSLKLGANWTLVLSGTTLQFKYGGTLVAQLTSAGAFTAKNDVIRNTSL